MPKIERRRKRENSLSQRTFLNYQLYFTKTRKRLETEMELIFPIKSQTIKNKNIDYLNNKVFFCIKEKLDKVKKLKSDEEITYEETIKKLIKQVFTTFYQKIITKNILKQLELSMVEHIFSFTLIKQTIPNKHHLCNNCFELYNHILYYIFEGKFKEKEYNFHRKSSIIENNLKIFDISIPKVQILNNSNNKYNKLLKTEDFHYLNSFASRDNINFELTDEDIKFDHQEFPFLKRKRITRRKKRISIHGILQKNEIVKKKTAIDNIIKNIKEGNDTLDKKKDDIKNIMLIEKFNETQKQLDKWNPLKKEVLFKIKAPKKNSMDIKLKQELLRQKKKLIFETKWKQDMSVLRNLGGDPNSKHCSLLKTQEIESIYSNSKSFEILLQLIDRGQTKLFFEQFRELRLHDINQQEKYTGDTLLIRATKCYNKQIIEYLLDKGANINMQNLELNSALHYAFLYVRNDLINVLIAHGADEKLINKKGLTPLECMRNYE